MITMQEYQSASKLFNLEVGLIQTVAAVESKGDGMLEGKPLILFEPHVFWRELKLVGIKPEDHLEGNKDILYPKWTPGKYGPVSKQHERLDRAAKIHREAALKSCSWGTFQIMGFNYSLTGCKTIQEFVNVNYGGNGSQLGLFLRFLEKTKLDRALRSKDWRGFAAGYNGKDYEVHGYHTRLEKTYTKLKGN
jgi:hypothetical protein